MNNSTIPSIRLFHRPSIRLRQGGKIANTNYVNEVAENVLRMGQVPTMGCQEGYIVGGGTQIIPCKPSAADVASGIYKAGIATRPVGPISTSTNLTSSGGGNDLWVYPTGDSASAIRIYAPHEVDLATSRHDLDLTHVYGCVPWTLATDGTNTYPGYRIICDLSIDAPCVTG